MSGEMALMDPEFCFNGGCARCANGSVDLFNTEADVPYEGAIALCRDCISDLANRAGVIKPRVSARRA